MLVGHRITPYTRPVDTRTPIAKREVQPQPLSAGRIGADRGYWPLRMPAAVVERSALSRPSLLPSFPLIKGLPHFYPDASPGDAR